MANSSIRGLVSASTRTSAIGPAMLAAAAVVAFSATGAMADIVGVGGAVVLRDPPASILLNQWESSTEIRGWFERQVTLTSPLSLGHVNPGFVDNETQLVGGTVTSDTTVQSYMVRLDPVAQGPITLTGFVVFDTPILGVLIGSQLGPTDALLGRPGITYNANSFRGLELNGVPGEDAFQISADRLRIDFVVNVGEWTDDIRILTAVPSPSAAAILGLGGLMAARRRR